MKHEKLSEALQQLSDRHIAEAASYKRKRIPWVAAVAAVLALAILVGSMLPGNTPGGTSLQGPANPLPTSPDVSMPPLQQVELLSQKYAVSQAQYPVLCGYPKSDVYDGDAYSKWWADQRELHNQPLGYADNLRTTWQALVPSLLSGQTGNNAACSPLNIYMALAMLAECAAGESREEILNLLNADSMESLRTQAKDVWRGHYNDDGLNKSILGSSLWLEEGYGFNRDTVALLAENYYASVFQGDLGTDEMNKALRSWLNEQTDGLLQDQVQDMELSADAVLALATTISYQVQWKDEFNKALNTQAVFHGAAGDTVSTFMHRELTYGTYYWTEHFGAVHLALEDGSRMWLILPDEGVSPEEITQEVMEFLTQNPGHTVSDFENKKSIRIQLSLPKFDVSGKQDVVDKLKSLGVTDVFSADTADLSSIVPQDDGGFISRITHAARVLIDEVGLTAAAYTVIEEAGASMPPKDEIDFTLDRPFIFVVESQDSLPLFAGIVNEA